MENVSIMANNSLAAYTPTIIARTIKIMRKRLALMKYVTTDYDVEMVPVGASLQIPVTSALTAATIVPSNTPPALTGITPTSKTLTLDNFKAAPFSLSASDLNTMMANTDFVPAQLEEGASAIANAINTSVFGQYVNIPYYVGTAGTNPFATNLNVISEAAKVMNDNLANPFGRRMILSNAAVYGANTLGNMIQAFQRGNADTLNTGELGNLQGFDCQRDDTVPTHTAGTGSGILINDAGVLVGDTSVPIDTGTGTLVVGDIFTVAGDTQTYVVTTAVADVSSATLNFYPAAKVAWANNAAVTVKASHVVNLGMERGAFALGMRTPRNPEKAQNIVIPFVDDGSVYADEGKPTGMTFFLSMVPGYWAETLEVGALWGSTTLRPERAVIMAG